MWWQDLLWGFSNGMTAWVVFIVHLFGAWEQYPFYNIARSGGWYDFGFLIGAGSPLLGMLGRPRSAPVEARPPRWSGSMAASER